MHFCDHWFILEGNCSEEVSIIQSCIAQYYKWLVNWVNELSQMDKIQWYEIFSSCWQQQNSAKQKTKWLVYQIFISLEIDSFIIHVYIASRWEVTGWNGPDGQHSWYCSSLFFLKFHSFSFFFSLRFSLVFGNFWLHSGYWMTGHSLLVISQWRKAHTFLSYWGTKVIKG